MKKAVIVLITLLSLTATYAQNSNVNYYFSKGSDYFKLYNKEYTSGFHGDKDQVLEYLDKAENNYKKAISYMDNSSIGRQNKVRAKGNIEKVKKGRKLVHSWYDSQEAMEKETKTFNKIMAEHFLREQRNESIEKKQNAALENYIKPSYFTGFTKNDYDNFITTAKRSPVTYIHKDDVYPTDIKVQSNCNAYYDSESRKFVNKEHCSSKWWMRDFKKKYSDRSLNPYEFILDFSLTSSFTQSGNWPLQVMLGNSPTGYAWLGINAKGTLYISYKNKEGFQDILYISKADHVYLNKPNHIRFIWLPNGYFYVELNTYKKWIFEIPEAIQELPYTGLSNRIVFHSDIIINKLELNTLY